MDVIGVDRSDAKQTTRVRQDRDCSVGARSWRRLILGSTERSFQASTTLCRAAVDACMLFVSQLWRSACLNLVTSIIAFDEVKTHARLAALPLGLAEILGECRW